MVKAVLFDMDGVLIEIQGELIGIFQDALVEFGFKRPGRRKIWKVHAHGVRNILRALVPQDAQAPKLMKRMENRVAEMWIERVRETKVNPDAKFILGKLKRLGLKLAVVTNRGRTTRPLLKKLGMLRYFDVIVTARDTPYVKPHPAPIRLALRRLGVTRNDAIFVGDHEVDILAGKRAGIKTLVLTKRKVADRIKSLREILGLLDGK